jgi:hypothetical protein
MIRQCLLSLLSVSIALLAADGQSWKDKPIAQWNDDDTKQILTDSPWAKTIQPAVDKPDGQRQPRGMGRGGGIGIGGIGIGIPGMGGMGRRGGMGGPGGGDPGGPPGGGRGENGPDPGPPPTLRIRWASALPVRAAELKARDTSAPAVDESHYAIVIRGVPDRMVDGNSEDVAHQLKKQAAIKRDGKKDLKPSSVEVARGEGGPVIVYLFPRSNEITKKDKRIEFQAKIFRLQFTQAFDVDDMTYQGKLEL